MIRSTAMANVEELDKKIAIFPISEDDLEKLKRFNAVMFPVNYQPKFYDECRAVPEVTLLAFDEADLVASIACRLEQQVEGAKLYIMTLGVLAPYRRQGIATTLLHRVLGFCQQDQNIVEAYLHVQISNEEAIAFYEKYGFKIVETIENYYRRIDPPHCYVLAKGLQVRRDPAPS